MSVAITVYRREQCRLCDEAERTIENVVDDLDVAVTVTTHDVDADPELEAEYGERVPYVEVEGSVTFEHRVDEARLRSALADAA
ncbi:glutaredoxin family protein [Halarchaeum nitratireducens]|uniref:Thioredoxin family protein n=1 Tax=Halarchaeum nitratireducens TaxID=489913 RepID=A0A830G9N7_9EURY|nr:glutaredoxin family protein [Halarchaeum nitratireducens]GGN12006.1 thioredoxin family protein [Halarchaeum nitratireducens]